MSFHICFNVLGFYKPFRILHTLRTTATKDTSFDFTPNKVNSNRCENGLHKRYYHVQGCQEGSYEHWWCLVWKAAVSEVFNQKT